MHHNAQLKRGGKAPVLGKTFFFFFTLLPLNLFFIPSSAPKNTGLFKASLFSGGRGQEGVLFSETPWLY